MRMLPTSVEVGGKEYKARTDFDTILDIIGILNDVDLSDQERAFLSLLYFYPDFKDIPQSDYEEALEQCLIFINGGKKEEPKQEKMPRLVDWEKDFPLIVAPVNRILGREIRTGEPIHWWTFLAAYMEIGECTYSNVLKIRKDLSSGKKLDKAEREWYRNNHDIVDIETKYTQADEEFLKKWGGG